MPEFVHHQCTVCTIDAPYTSKGAGRNAPKILTVFATSAPCAPFLQYTHVRARAREVVIKIFFYLLFYIEKGSQGSLRILNGCFYSWFVNDALETKGAVMVHDGAWMLQRRGLTQKGGGE